MSLLFVILPYYNMFSPIYFLPPTINLIKLLKHSQCLFTNEYLEVITFKIVLYNNYYEMFTHIQVCIQHFMVIIDECVVFFNLISNVLWPIGHHVNQIESTNIINMVTWIITSIYAECTKIRQILYL